MPNSTLNKIRKINFTLSFDHYEILWNFKKTENPVFYFDKSLKIKEKEPLYWLSLLNVPFGAGNGTPIELLRSPLMGFLLCLRANEKIFEECENIFQKK